MKIPQMLYVALLFISLGVNIALHGKPKDGTHNFWTALVGAVIQITLLTWGGFFS